MSRIVDRDRGRSVLMSGIVWCYLESLVTTSRAQMHSREFLWAIRDRVRKDADCYKNVAQPGWQGASLWINDLYRVTIPEPFVTRENNQSWALRLKSIWNICCGRSDQSGCIYLTPFVVASGYCGDNLSCDRQYLETLSPAVDRSRVSASHLWLVQLITRMGIMLPADNEDRVTRQLASQDTR